MKKYSIILLGITFLILPLSMRGKNGKTDDKNIDLLLDQKIELRDGIKLSANIYKPAGLKEPHPAIFTFTPYISDEGQKLGPFFTSHGYVYVHVDVRGRGNSEGEFFPLEKDGQDGAQVVEWIAKQPWCNGAVAMRGGSYRGMVQWQILKHFPPALKTIVPTAAAAPGIDFPMFNNIFYSYIVRWLGFTMSRTGNTNLFSDEDFWVKKYYTLYHQHLPFSKLAEITGSNQKIFNRWLEHPTYDNYWEEMSFPDHAYKKIDIPILSITGHFDGDQPGAMHYYTKHMRYGNKEAQENHFLIIGPWDHAGTRYPQKELAGLVFADNAVLNMEKLHLAWYDWILKGKEKPEFLKKRICYYLMKENQWKHADSLGDLSNKKMVWYLSSRDGEAGDVFHSGYLKTIPPKGRQKPDILVYDPQKIIPKTKYLEGRRIKNYLLDQRSAFSEEILVYHSQPLKKSLEVAGRAVVRLYIELNVPDTDFGMELFEICHDGKAILLAQDIIRARFRKSTEKQELITPGKINLYLLNKSNFFARKLRRGSRVRLIISSINTPDFEKNYNSGGIVAEETGKDARKAVIKLYHDKRYPSTLELPIKTHEK